MVGAAYCADQLRTRTLCCLSAIRDGMNRSKDRSHASLERWRPIVLVLFEVGRDLCEGGSVAGAIAVTNRIFALSLAVEVMNVFACVYGWPDVMGRCLHVYDTHGLHDTWTLARQVKIAAAHCHLDEALAVLSVLDRKELSVHHWLSFEESLLNVAMREKRNDVFYGLLKEGNKLCMCVPPQRIECERRRKMFREIFVTACQRKNESVVRCLAQDVFHPMDPYLYRVVPSTVFELCRAFSARIVLPLLRLDEDDVRLHISPQSLDEAYQGARAQNDTDLILAIWTVRSTNNATGRARNNETVLSYSQ
jgi:hypothetical protein